MLLLCTTVQLNTVPHSSYANYLVQLIASLLLQGDNGYAHASVSIQTNSIFLKQILQSFTLTFPKFQLSGISVQATYITSRGSQRGFSFPAVHYFTMTGT